MDEMKLLEDFRAPVVPPDADILARARSHMLAGNRARAGGRALGLGMRGRWPKLALAGTVAAAAVTLSVVLPGGAGGTFVTKAWAVERNANGTVTVTVRQQIQDPAGLQQALRHDGITAFVQVHPLTNRGQACVYAHVKTESQAVQNAVISADLSKPQSPGSRHASNGTVQPPAGRPAAGQLSWTIHPAAMPRGSALLFADWVGQGRVTVGLGVQPEVLSTDTSPACVPVKAP